MTPGNNPEYLKWVLENAKTLGFELEEAEGKSALVTGCVEHMVMIRNEAHDSTFGYDTRVQLTYFSGDDVSGDQILHFLNLEKALYRVRLDKLDERAQELGYCGFDCALAALEAMAEDDRPEMAHTPKREDMN